MPLEQVNLLIKCLFDKCRRPFRSELKLKTNVDILAWQLIRTFSIRGQHFLSDFYQRSSIVDVSLISPSITSCSLMTEGSQFTHRGCDKGDSGFDLIYIDIQGLQQLVMLAPDPGARSLIWAKYR